MIKGISQFLKDEPLLVMFSTGKDSIVMTDLLIKNYQGRLEFVFLYFVDGLEIKERILRHYEKRYGIAIHRQPHFTSLSMKTGKKYKMADIERGLRANYNISYIAQGYKKTDSMARRGMLARLPMGIDERNKKVYPVAEWNDKKILSYIKLNKLPLPVEYNHGLKHDFSVPDIDFILYLKNNFPDDYQKIIAEFPRLEAMVWARTN
jgi:sulfate adenylyltransferase subunit 2